MEIQKNNWNVIIRGAWNRAILTPQWISLNIFKLPENTPIEVQVTIDRLGPIRVKYEGLIVVVTQGYLEILTETSSFENLNRARELGIKAMNELPITPFEAAGINMRYKFDGVTQRFSEIMKSPLDTNLAVSDYEIEDRKNTRVVRTKEGLLSNGIITATANIKSNKGIIEFNFHKGSNEKQDLIDWLKIPMEEVEKTVNWFIKEMTEGD